MDKLSIVAVSDVQLFLSDLRVFIICTPGLESFCPSQPLRIVRAALCGPTTCTRNNLRTISSQQPRRPLLVVPLSNVVVLLHQLDSIPTFFEDPADHRVL